MQEVKFSKSMLNSLEFDTLLTLEQAEWYTQNEGFIPLPRKSNKKNLYVIFTSQYSDFLFKFIKKKILKYRNSRIISEDGYIEGFIIVLEIEKSSSNHYYCFDTLENKKILKDSFFNWFKDLLGTYGYDYGYTFITH